MRRWSRWGDLTSPPPSSFPQQYRLENAPPVRRPHRRIRPEIRPGGRGPASGTSSEHKLYAFVLPALALVARDPHLPHLARVGDVRAAVSLRVQSHYLYDPDPFHPLWYQVDLGADEVGIGKRLLALQFVYLYRTVFGEGFVGQAFYLTNNVGGPIAWKREIHPGTVRTHLSAGHFRFEIAPDHTGEHVQGRVITHVRVPSFPIQGSLEVPHGIGDSGVQHVYHAPTFTSRIHDGRPHRTDAEGSFIRGLPSATWIKGGPVQDHFAALELHDARFELPHVGVAREKFSCGQKVEPPISTQ